MARVMFFKHDRTNGTEIICRCSRTWVLNRPDEELGTATITVGLKEPLLSEDLLRFRGIVYVRDVNQLLPDWAGQIGEPQAYNQSEVSIAANAYEIILSDRHPRKARISGPGGAMVSEVLSAANIVPTLIDPGDITDKGASANVRGFSKSALTLLFDIQERAGGEWEVVPALDPSGAPLFTLNYALALGTDYRGSDIHLEEGVNIELASGALMTIQGRVKNRVVVRAQATTDESSLGSGPFTDEESRDLYGFAEALYVETHKTQASTITSAQSHLAAESTPYRVFSGLVCNDPLIYPYLRVGNVMLLRLHTIGYQAGQVGGDYDVRIVEMTADDERPGVELIVEEI